MASWSQRAAACLLFVVLASAGQGQQSLPQPRPLPTNDEPSAAGQPQARVPRPRPPTDGRDGAVANADRSEAAAAESAPPAANPPPPAVDAGQEIACRQRLQALGVAYEEMPPIDGEGVCGAAAPIRVGGLGGGIDLTPPATLNCEMAEALARWAHDVVVPAAERHLDATPTSFVNAADYVCRTRNNRPGAKMSEHALANAIDIGSIAFAEAGPVPILARSPQFGRERAFQRAIRRGACAHFTTVIGPGTNAAHATHFHFDLAKRRGGHRLCE